MDIHGYKSRWEEGRLDPNKTTAENVWASLNTLLFLLDMPFWENAKQPTDIFFKFFIIDIFAFPAMFVCLYIKSLKQ